MAGISAVWKSSVQKNDAQAGRTPALVQAADWIRSRKRFLSGLLWLAGIVVLLALLEWIEWPFLRLPVESALQHALSREVTISPPFGIRFIGHLRIRAGVFAVAAAPDGPTPAGEQRDLLRASALKLSVPYATLISLLHAGGADRDLARRERLHIGKLEVNRLEAALVRSADGRANWRFGKEDKKDSAPLALPEFGRLAIESGAILVDDALNRIHLEATVKAHEGSTASGVAEGAAGLEVNARGTYHDQNLTFRLRSDGLLRLAETGANAPLAPLRLEARVGASELDFDGSARDLMHLARVDGQFRLAGRSLAAVGAVVGITLPTTAAFSMRGRVLKEGMVWSAAIGELSVGRSRLNGDFRYDPTRRVPKLTGQLGGARLSLPDLGPAVGAENAASRGAHSEKIASRDLAARNSAADAKDPAAPAPAPAAERVLPQRDFDIPSLAAMDADVAVALDQFDWGTAQLETMAPMRARLVLDNRLLTLKDIVARTSGGELLGTLSLNARQQVPLWTADLRWSGVQLETFVKPRDVADRSSGYLSGILGGRARLAGNGRSTAAILGTLDGDVQMWVSNGSISHFLVEVVGLDIAQALGVFVRGDAHLPMRCAVTALAVRQGKASAEVAVIETSDSTLRATGVISFADERLKLEFRAKPKDVSPMTLRAPVFVEGTFSQPQVRIEKTAIGLRVAAAAALAAVTPLAAVLALIDLGESEKRACQEAIGRVQNAAQKPQTTPNPRQP
jgi:uncharacterized protein involved in outer membrane biogenesis